MADRTELKIPPGGSSKPSEEVRDCLSFRYRDVPESLEMLRQRAESGMQILAQVVAELRAKGYVVSEPWTGKKSFGVSSIKCEIGSNPVWIVALPPEPGDKWLLRLQCRANDRFLPLAYGLSEELHPVVVTAGVTNVSGTRELRWIDYRTTMPPGLRYLSKVQW
jgi:hypothetical protein